MEARAGLKRQLIPDLRGALVEAIYLYLELIPKIPIRLLSPAPSRGNPPMAARHGPVFVALLVATTIKTSGSIPIIPRLFFWPAIKAQSLLSTAGRHGAPGTTSPR